MSRSDLSPRVLLAEDSEDDAFFFRWTLHKCGLPCELVHARDGAEALRFLEAAADSAGQRSETCPDLVFLDLKMPALTGFEVLAWIQQHPFDPPLEVAVLSGSEHATDVERARKLGATGYFVKPISVEQLRTRFTDWHRRHGEAAASTPTSAHAAPRA